MRQKIASLKDRRQKKRSPLRLTKFQLESAGKRHFYFGHVCGAGGEEIPIHLGKTGFEPEQTGRDHDLIKVDRPSK